MGTKEKIVEIISEEGPLLPVEIAAKAELNSFLAKGYLEDLLKEGKVKAEKQKAGSEPLFYLPGQEDRLEEKREEAENTAVKIKNYKERKIEENPELKKKREEFMERLRKIENREREQEEENTEEEREPESEEEEKKSSFKDKIKESVFQKKEEREEEQEEKEKEKVEEEEESFLKKAEDFLENNEVKIIEKIDEKKKREELIVSIPSKLRPIKHIVMIRDKKKLSKSDLALAYTKSLEEKMPSLVITHGKLTKTAKEYLNNTGELLTVKQL